MLDIQFIRDNPQTVKDKSRQKGYAVDKEVDTLLDQDKKYRKLLQEIEDIRRQRNELAKRSDIKDRQEFIEKGKALKEQEKKLAGKLPDINFI